MSLDARDLILNLLNRNPKKRMGAGERDAAELKEHAFFKGVDWEATAAGQVEMPHIVPNAPKVNPEAEIAFKKGELESEHNMNKVYKQIS